MCKKILMILPTQGHIRQYILDNKNTFESSHVIIKPGTVLDSNGNIIDFIAADSINLRFCRGRSWNHMIIDRDCKLKKEEYEELEAIIRSNNEYNNRKLS